MIFHSLHTWIRITKRHIFKQFFVSYWFHYSTVQELIQCFLTEGTTIVRESGRVNDRDYFVRRYNTVHSPGTLFVGSLLKPVVSLWSSP